MSFGENAIQMQRYSNVEIKWQMKVSSGYLTGRNFPGNEHLFPFPVPRLRASSLRRQN